MNLIFRSLVVATGVIYIPTLHAEPSTPSPSSSVQDATDATLLATSNQNLTQLPPFQNGHFYLGGRLGWAAYDGACGNSALDCTDDTFGYGLYGGYQFNSWFALEGGATSYGSPDARYPAGDVSADVYGGEVVVKLDYPLTERINVFTRLGGAYQYIEKEIPAIQGDSSSHEWNVLSSLGVSYRLSQNWSVRGEYQFIDGIGDGSIGQADSHFTSIGLTYHFNQQAPVIEPTPIEPATRYVTIEKPLSLSAQTLFAFDSTTVVTNQSLDLLVEQLTSYPEDKVQILGYTDNSGSEAYNQRLSEQRAKAVAAYLTEKGIDASRLTVVGKGEANPVASNDTQQGRVQNRRVEVRFDTTINQTLEATDSPNETN